MRNFKRGKASHQTRRFHSPRDAFVDDEGEPALESGHCRRCEDPNTEEYRPPPGEYDEGGGGDDDDDDLMHLAVPGSMF